MVVQGPYKSCSAQLRVTYVQDVFEIVLKLLGEPNLHFNHPAIWTWMSWHNPCIRKPFRAPVRSGTTSPTPSLEVKRKASAQSQQPSDVTTAARTHQAVAAKWTAMDGSGRRFERIFKMDK